jgi:hypothetical protein
MGNVLRDARMSTPAIAGDEGFAEIVVTFRCSEQRAVV